MPLQFFPEFFLRSNFYASLWIGRGITVENVSSEMTVKKSKIFNIHGIEQERAIYWVLQYWPPTINSIVINHVNSIFPKKMPIQSEHRQSIPYIYLKVENYCHWSKYGHCSCNMLADMQQCLLLVIVMRFVFHLFQILQITPPHVLCWNHHRLISRLLSFLKVLHLYRVGVMSYILWSK